jgi:hypothetical protein
MSPSPRQGHALSTNLIDTFKNDLSKSPIPSPKNEKKKERP